MTNQHPTTPPPELVQQWLSDFYGSTVAPGEAAIDIATQAPRWGADQELEAPTDEELIRPIIWMLDGSIYDNDKGEIAQSLRELVARWGTPAIHPVPVAPTDEELLKLMPETMLDEFSYAAKVCSDATGGQVKPGIFRVSLNTGALDYARAVLARWGQQ
jgi:hypothetical protein